MFSLDFDSLVSTVDLESFEMRVLYGTDYIEALIPEFLSFCYWHNLG